MADCFSVDAVLLRRKVERDIVGLVDAVNLRGCGIAAGFANGKGDVAEAERVGLRVGAALAVLPGAEKEEESHDGQISNSLLSGGCGREESNGIVDVNEEAERDGSHFLSGQRVLFVVGTKLMVEAEAGCSEAVMTWVRGPHAGEDLGHGAKVLLHGPLAYWLAIGGKVAMADLVSKHLEEGNGVLEEGNGVADAGK
jgi:hypothetical protein